MKKRIWIAAAAILAIAAVIAVIVLTTRPKDTAEPAAETAVTAEAPAEKITEAPAEAAAEAQAAAPAEDPVLVSVNGYEIRESDPTVQFFINYYLKQVGEPDEETRQLIRQYALDNTIAYRVIAQKLEEAGKMPTDADFAAEKERMKAQWEEIVTNLMSEQAGVGTDASEEDRAAARADVLSYIETNFGYTEESYIEEGVFSMPYERARELTGTGDPVTDDQVLAYFQELVEEDKESMSDIFTYEYYTQYMGYDSLYVPEGYRGISHILLDADPELMEAWQDLQVRLEDAQEAEEETDTASDEADAEATPAGTEEPVTQDMVDAAKKAVLDSVQSTVDEIKAKLEAGADFEELIKEYGTDPGMEDDTARAEGYPVHKESIIYDPAFTSGAAALEKVGDISEPVVSSMGVHILHYLRDIPGGAAELTDEMKAEIREVLEGDNADTAFNEGIEKWIAEAAVEWTEAGEPWKIPEEETVSEESAE